MVRLSNLADYAVVLMIDAASHLAGRVSAAHVSDSTAIPSPTVAKLMGMLSRAGLLESRRGAGGGFVLARPAEDISVADIIEAVDGPIALTQCVDHRAEDCAMQSFCTMRAHWPVLNEAVRSALSSVSLADLLARSQTAPVVLRSVAQPAAAVS